MMRSPTRHLTLGLTLVVVGLLMGMGAALVAGVQVAQNAVDDATSLDALAGLAESTTRLHAATNQAVLVLATTPPDEKRALRLAVVEARATLEAMSPYVEAIDPDDTALVSATEQYVAAAAGLLDLAAMGPEAESEQPRPVALELAHRNLIDAINDRRILTRSALATSVGGSGAAVTATALVILVLPSAAIFVFSRLARTRAEAQAEVMVTMSPAMPSRLTRELEERAMAIVDHARIVAWTRPHDHDAAPYRSLLSEAGGLLRVTRNLIAFDRLEAGDVLVSGEPTDLGELVERIRIGALETGTSIEVVADGVEVLADAVRLHQCLENLVGIVAGHGALNVGLVVGRDKGRGTICVVGEGCTIPSEVLRVLQNDARPQRAGALALAVVRRLVADMSGTLTHRQVETTAVFTIALPVAGGRPR